MRFTGSNGFSPSAKPFKSLDEKDLLVRDSSCTSFLWVDSLS